MAVTLRFYLLAAILLTVFALLGQGKTRQVISPEGDTVSIKPIPLSEIPNRIETTINSFKKIESNIEPTGRLVKFDSVRELYKADIERKKTELETREEYFSQLSVENDIREWENLKDMLSQVKQTINDRVKSLQMNMFDVEVSLQTWDTTVESAQSGGVPDEVLSSEKELLTRIKQIKKDLNAAQNEALRKQNQLTDIIVTIDEVINDLQNKRRALQSDYFIQDAPPIWKAGDSTTNLTSVKGQLYNNRSESKRNINSFFETYERTIYVQLILFFLLWLGLYLLQRTALRMKDDNEEEDTENITKYISHHALSALILALFASIWLYPSLPNIIGHLLQFTYIIIALILLPRYIDKRINKLLIGLILLFLLSQFQTLFLGKVLFARLMVMMENFLSGYLLFLIINPRGFISKELKKQKWGFLLKIIPLFFLFLAVSFVGNVFGFVDLSMLLNSTVVNTLFNLNLLLLAITVLNRVAVILLRTPFMQGSNMIRNHTEKFEKWFFTIIQVGAVLLLFRSILRLLGLWVNIQEWFNEFITETYKVGNTSIEIGGIITFILVIIITIVVFRLIKALLNEELFPRVTMARGIPGAISMITGYVIVAFGFFLALGSITDLSSFGLLAGALGVGIGFGLQGIVANFIAGIVLAFERPIQVGDEIELPTTMGIVTSIGVRSTTVRTYDGSEVIIPNSDLITKDVINWTLSDRKKRRDIYIGVAYGTDPDVVLELIKQVASEHPNVMKIPAPWALFDGFGDNSLNFRIRVWTTMDTGMTTKSEVTVAIYDALREAGISIPFPQRDLHIKSIDQDIKQELTWQKPPARKPGQTKPKPQKKDKPEPDQD